MSDKLVYFNYYLKINYYSKMKYMFVTSRIIRKKKRTKDRDKREGENWRFGVVGIFREPPLR